MNITTNEMDNHSFNLKNFKEKYLVKTIKMTFNDKNNYFKFREL